MKYTVTFIQNHTYEVDAASYAEAEIAAYKKFKNDMCCAVARTHYDEIEIECDEDEDD